jgi:hypothetical protein
MASGVTVADRNWQLIESARHGSASPSSHSLDTAFDEVCRIPPEESASRHVRSFHGTDPHLWWEGLISPVISLMGSTLYILGEMTSNTPSDR